MFVLKFALKNLLRHKRRTLITASALGFGIMLFILMDSMLKGAFEQSNRNIIEVETGDGKIMSHETYEDIKYLPLSNRIENPEEIVRIVEDLGGEAVPRVNVFGEMIYSEEYFAKSGSSSIMFSAVDIERDNRVFNVFKESYLEDGRFFIPGNDEVVLGAWLAEDIGAEVGDWVTLSLRTAADGDDPGYQQTIDVEIVGLLNVPSPVVNRRVVYYPLDMADFSLDLNGSATEVAIKFPKGTSQIEFEIALEERLDAGFSFYHWRELAKEYLALVETKSDVSSMFLFMVAIIAVVGITNTLLMTINERQKELGMMRALGMADKEIRRSFIFEAAGIGLLGALIGIVLGVALNIPLVNVGIDYSAGFREMDLGYRLNSVMKGVWNGNTIVTSLIFGTLLTSLVSIIPTKRAIKKSIPDCINGR